MGYVGKTAKFGWSSCGILALVANIVEKCSMYIEEVQLICCTANAVGKEEDIPLQPCYFLRWILKTCTWSGHFGCYER